MSLRDHAPRRLLHREEGAESRDLDRFAHRFGIDLGDRAGRPGARIIEDDIGRAEPRVGFLEELRDRRRVGRIGGEALGPRLGGERRELIDVARRQTELEAGCRQRASN